MISIVPLMLQMLFKTIRWKIIIKITNCHPLYNLEYCVVSDVMLKTTNNIVALSIETKKII